MTKEELEKTEEYDLIIRFKSNKPKYEIRDYIIEHTLNEFDNLQMWDFKRSSEFAEPREKRIAELEAQIEKMKCCSMCKYYSISFIPYWCTKNNTAPHCTSKCDKWEIKEK